MKEQLIKYYGFKKREEGFIGIMIQRGVWLELNLKTKRTIIWSAENKYIEIKHARTLDRVCEIYKGLTGTQLRLNT